MSENPETLARELLMLEDGANAAQVDLAPVTGGMGGATVFRATRQGRPPRYLKIADDDGAEALRDEIARTVWLGERGIAVAKILRVIHPRDAVALLMAAMAGQPADVSALPTPSLAAALAKTMAALHAVPPALCPFDETLAVRLARAKRAVADGGVDPAEFEPRNRAIPPAVLLRRLTAAPPPAESIVVVHGDATLNNIMIDDDGTVGFIDCGNSGRADRYTDLAVLCADIEAHRGRQAAAQFMQVYGLHAYDAAKARFYSDLYEFF